MLFTLPEVVQIRQGKKQGHLLTIAEAAIAGKTYPIYRLRVDLGEAGQVLARWREPVYDQVTGGERRPSILTVIETRELWITDATLTDAQVCGFRTSEELRADWRGRHPRLDRAKLVRFAVGDLRDRPIYLTATSRMRWAERDGGPAQGDYTTNAGQAADELEALRPEVVDAMAAMNRQRDVGRRVAAERRLAGKSLADRVARIEAAGDAARKDVRQELRIIEERVRRAERKVGSLTTR